MSITYTNTIDNFYELQDMCWSGARQVLDIVAQHDMEDEFMDYLEDNFIFCMDTTPTITEINDFIWFECDDWLDENIPKEDDEDEE